MVRLKCIPGTNCEWYRTLAYGTNHPRPATRTWAWATLFSSSDSCYRLPIASDSFAASGESAPFNTSIADSSVDDGWTGYPWQPIIVRKTSGHPKNEALHHVLRDDSFCVPLLAAVPSSTENTLSSRQQSTVQYCSCSIYSILFHVF